jgi:hypothetical protein
MYLKSTLLNPGVSRACCIVAVDAYDSCHRLVHHQPSQDFLNYELSDYFPLMQVRPPRASGTASMQQHSSLCQMDSPCQTRWSSEQHAAFITLARDFAVCIFCFCFELFLLILLSTLKFAPVKLCSPEPQ